MLLVQTTYVIFGRRGSGKTTIRLQVTTKIPLLYTLKTIQQSLLADTGRPAESNFVSLIEPSRRAC